MSSPHTEFHISSAIKAQLLGLSLPRSVSSEAGITTTGERNYAPSLCQSGPISQLIDLLAILKVPFINTSKHVMEDPDIAILGQGGYAEVTFDGKATVNSNETVAVAIKEFKSLSNVDKLDATKPNELLSGSAVVQFFNEICVMKHPSLSTHANILRLYGTTETDLGLGLYPTATSKLSLVTEYADLGCLEAYLGRERGKLDWNFKYNIICDIAAGLRALHSTDIVHNDVKCSNILLFSTPGPNQRITAKVSDFGCSILLATTKPQKGAAATRLFAAPEAYSSQCIVYPSRDVYSFGLLIFQVMRESVPFHGLTRDEVWEYKQNPPALLKYMHSCFKTASLRPPSIFCNALVETTWINPEERISEFSKLLHLPAGEFFPPLYSFDSAG